MTRKWNLCTRMDGPLYLFACDQFLDGQVQAHVGECFNSQANTLQSLLSVSLFLHLDFNAWLFTLFLLT